jgi:predicted RNA-binding Zn-ribbon protein involved in translation (DUF1610 family)
MIICEPNYAMAIEEWQSLLDGQPLPPQQQRFILSQLAGVRAEKDMAYYLCVAMREKPEFAVFNNLKVDHDGLTAQIDHLVLTRWTAYFIESKSVSQSIYVNEHGEWGRVWGRRFASMESPVEQSHRHQQVLYDFLNAHREQFMGKLLGLKTKGFAKLLTPQHYVAISPRGQIRGRGRDKFPQVKKADQVSGAILEHHGSLSTGILSTSLDVKDMAAFSKQEFQAVIEFLQRSNTATSPVEQAHQAIADLERQAAAAAAKERDVDDADVAEAPSPEPPAAKTEGVKEPSGGKAVVANADAVAPACPRCGASMVLRTAKTGKNAGERFWGCPQFPRCRGIVNA